MNWRGDIALGGNAMSSITLGRDTQLTARANLNSRGAGQLTLRARRTVAAVTLVMLTVEVEAAVRTVLTDTVAHQVCSATEPGASVDLVRCARTSRHARPSVKPERDAVEVCVAVGPTEGRG